MRIEFTKMNGAGNDFVLIDNRKTRLKLSPEQIQTLCHRQCGIGADGVLLLRQAKGDADLGWDFFNQDGSEAEMCGNGARCFARFAQRQLDGRNSISFENLLIDLPRIILLDDKVFFLVTHGLFEPIGNPLKISLDTLSRFIGQLESLFFKS